MLFLPGYEIVYDGGKEVNNGSSHGKHMSTIKKLKHSLLHKYDSTLIPLAEKGENLRVKVGFAFRQVISIIAMLRESYQCDNLNLTYHK